MHESPQSYDTIVLGAGAAGLMCAIEAGRAGRRVVLLDHANRAGKKILISGGGRCNFTHLHTTAENFHSANPHFIKSALASYTPADFVAMVERHHIRTHEKSPGQLFCDGSAQQIVSMLLEECRAAGVTVTLNTKIAEVLHGTSFSVHTKNAIYSAPALVIATGGLSIPKMGATALGYQIAEQFGHTIIPCRPALVPLTFAPEDHAHFDGLAGLSTEVRAAVLRQSFRDKMLFTHKGLSGPAILQISSYWRPGESIQLDLDPGSDWTAVLANPKLPKCAAALRDLLRTAIPERLADRWLSLHPPENWTRSALVEWHRALHSWPFTPAGTEGYAKAEVTAGGVSTAELSAQTMESRRVPGLFFIGEVVDVTGQLGGYNFQWAWSSGVLAGRAMRPSVAELQSGNNPSI